MKVTNSPDTMVDGVPRSLVESLRRNRYIEECGQIVERHARADGNDELLAEMRRRALETRRLRFEVLHAIRVHRRIPARNHAVPRPRVRARRPRAAARRAAGERSGADPGSDDGEPHRPPPRRRGGLRHLSHAVADYLERIRPDEGGRR